MINEILDGTIIFLLVAAMIYGYRLNRRISIIHNSRKELGDLFKVFDQTIVKAYASVEDLKFASQEAGAQLQKKVDQAVLLIDDISFVAERAEKLLDTMEASVHNEQQKRHEHLDLTTLPSDKKKTAQKEKQAASKSTFPDNAKKSKEQREKVLEALLTEISHKRETGESVIGKAKGKPANDAGSNKSSVKKDEIATMLKALGYGQTS